MRKNGVFLKSFTRKPRISKNHPRNPSLENEVCQEPLEKREAEKGNASEAGLQ